ncbi:linear amide C-N hydrolase [bacterium D16-76]|nr:linear amide C-N hydrolase [bacterium D16-76]
MCTSIAMARGDFFFGRNMDWDCGFGERVAITPRRFPFDFRKARPMHRHYAMIGMGALTSAYPLYAEASNEKGLCMAGLNFPQNAWYSPKIDPVKNNISPFELIPWVLGQCATVGEARCLLENTHLVSIPYSDKVALSPLHWHIADKSGSIALESTKDGMHVYDNPLGVMTNNPPFPFQLQNVCQYLNLDPGTPRNCFSSIDGLEPFGYGLGSVGLPGDFSPASRFVKAAYLAVNSICHGDEDSCVAQMFHLLGSVAMVRGSVVAPGGELEMTTYTCAINATKGRYYFTSYHNSGLTGVELFQEDLEGEKLVTYPLEEKACVNWLNRRQA